jgi:hypothetical protein
MYKLVATVCTHMFLVAKAAGGLDWRPASLRVGTAAVGSVWPLISVSVVGLAGGWGLLEKPWAIHTKVSL